MDLKLFWSPPNKSTSSSSIAKYFTDLGYNVEQHEIDVKLNLNTKFRIPEMNKLFINDIVEYVGLNLLDCDTEDFDQNLVTYYPELHLGEKKDTMICHCKGLFTTAFLKSLFNILR